MNFSQWWSLYLLNFPYYYSDLRIHDDGILGEHRRKEEEQRIKEGTQSCWVTVLVSPSEHAIAELWAGRNERGAYDSTGRAEKGLNKTKQKTEASNVREMQHVGSNAPREAGNAEVYDKRMNN